MGDRDLAYQAVDATAKMMGLKVNGTQRDAFADQLQKISDPTLRDFTANVQKIQPASDGEGLKTQLTQAAYDAAKGHWELSAREPFKNAGEMLKDLYEQQQKVAAATPAAKAPAAAVKLAAAPKQGPTETQPVVLSKQTVEPMPAKTTPAQAIAAELRPSIDTAPKPATKPRLADLKAGTPAKKTVASNAVPGAPLNLLPTEPSGPRPMQKIVFAEASHSSFPPQPPPVDAFDPARWGLTPKSSPVPAALPKAAPAFAP